jgi:hypothetical protein
MFLDNKACVDDEKGVEFAEQPVENVGYQVVTRYE